MDRSLGVDSRCVLEKEREFMIIKGKMINKMK